MVSEDWIGKINGAIACRPEKGPWPHILLGKCRDEITARTSECERLRAEVERLTREKDEACERAVKAEGEAAAFWTERDAAIARAETAERDARRYCWFRSHLLGACLAELLRRPRDDTLISLAEIDQFVDDAISLGDGQ
jgi:hypothetical protein